MFKCLNLWLFLFWNVQKIKHQNVQTFKHSNNIFLIQGFNMFEIFWKNEKWCWKMWWMCRTIQNSGSDLFNIVSCSIAYGTRKVLILIVLYKHCYVPMADARRGLCLFNSLCILNRLIINFGIHDLLNVTMWIVIVFININK